MWLLKNYKLKSLNNAKQDGKLPQYKKISLHGKYTMDKNLTIRNSTAEFLIFTTTKGQDDIEVKIAE